MARPNKPQIQDDVEVVVACVCGAVEELEGVLTWEHDASQTQQEILEEIYRRKLWHHASETTMEETARWSLMRRVRVKSSYPRQQKQETKAAVDDWQRLVASTTREPLQRQLQSQLQRLTQTHADTKLPMPALLKLESVEEHELETRWDVYGCPQPLHRNILGERYATLEKPLSYRRQRDATEIFRLMRPRMKEELRLREPRRILRLNQQARAAHVQEKKALSPEEELEARLDQALIAKEDVAFAPETTNNNEGLRR